MSHSIERSQNAFSGAIERDSGGEYPTKAIQRYPTSIERWWQVLRQAMEVTESAVLFDTDWRGYASCDRGLKR